MTSSDTPLADYDRPPVVEVVFATALRSLPVSVVDLSAFVLESLGEDYPLRTEQAPMRMPVETFDETSQRLAPSLGLLAGWAPVRLWLQSADQTRLVQLQRDWIACNWQKAGNHAPYPRYERIEAFFLQVWDDLSSFVDRHGQGSLVAEQCELTYVNHILPGAGVWENHGQLDRVIRLAGVAGDFLPAPEVGQLGSRYRISADGRDVGRLHVQTLPGANPVDQRPLIQLNITARGAPLGEGRDGALAFFRLAHEWIVRGFAAVTTDAAQETLWGKHP
ncbi:MAG: TIGR04255 family protein [Acidimicrobiales bacterium]